MSTQHSRFKDAPWYSSTPLNIIVGGAGGIGSWLTLLLNRAGFSTLVYDFDMLEEHNLGGQLFPKSGINKPKVSVLNEVVNSFCDKNIVAFNEAINQDTITNRFVISAFDNMKARADMFTSWVESYGQDKEALFIDGRLQAEHMQIFCVRGGDAELIHLYKEEHLFDDADVEDAPCTMKQTSHSAAMIASHMVAFFTNHVSNIRDNEAIRSVPFYWEYFIPMNLITEK